MRFIVGLICLATLCAFTPDLNSWFESLHRKVDDFSCCGLGDAYTIRILQEADPSRPHELVGEAEIIDGRAKDIPTAKGDIHRRPMPDGYRFRFNYFNLAREAEGNPTAYAWAFLGVYADNVLSTVYCIVPLPPGV